MSRKVVILGTGGCGQDTLDIFDACNQQEAQFEVIGFLTPPRYGAAGTVINDKPILGDFDWLEKHAAGVEVICAVGLSHDRYRIVQRVMKMGGRFCSIIHPSVIQSRWVTIGSGVVIAAGSILTNQIKIGDHAHINLDCTLAHDVVMEPFATLAPGVHVSGNVTLEEGCYVGTGANIIQGLNVGAWSVVGAGSAVIRDVPANTTVVGVPGKVIKNREPGWHGQRLTKELKEY